MRTCMLQFCLRMKHPSKRCIIHNLLWPLRTRTVVQDISKCISVCFLVKGLAELYLGIC